MDIVKREAANENPKEGSDSQIDTLPGTSKHCNCCSNVERKSLNGIGEQAGVEIAPSHSAESFTCRICHINENSDKLISPCFCRGSLTYVHIGCLQRWISMSRCTTCELCQFQYNTEQSLRYTFYQSLRIWYSRSMSRRALQEDCQMFLLLTLIAFGIVGTLLVAVQYYILQSHVNGVGRVWTKGWLIFFLFTTLLIYLINVYMIAKAQLMPWYRWWQTARDIRLVIENHNPTSASLKHLKTETIFNPPAEATKQTTNQNAQICSGPQNLEVVKNAGESRPIEEMRLNNANLLTSFCSEKSQRNIFESQILRSSYDAAAKLTSGLNTTLQCSSDDWIATI